MHQGIAQATAEPVGAPLEAAGAASFETPAAQGAGALVRDACCLLASSGSRFWPFYDAVVSTLAVFLGHRLSPSFSFSADTTSGAAMVIGSSALFVVLGGVVSGLYERDSFESFVSLAVRVILAAFLSWAAIMAVSYALVFHLIGRWIIGISFACVVVGLLIPRALVRAGARRARRRVLLLGDRQCLSELRAILDRDGNGGFELVDLGRKSEASSALKGIQAASWTGGLSLKACKDAGVDVVVLADGQQSVPGQEIVEFLSAGVDVLDAVTFVERHFHRELIGCVDASYLVSAPLRSCRPSLCAIKRLTDVAAASMGLILTLPLWPLMALLIKLTSRGPTFYKQTRVGLLGKPFTIYKFRTMNGDAERDGRPVWAKPRDPRATAVGRILRKSRLDEIPQFWNILRGEMSFVGPRPERPEFVAQLTEKTPCYNWRHLLRPGLTGWAQVKFHYGGNEQDAREKLSYDLYYVKHVSFLLDAYIGLRTLGVFVRGSR